MVKRGPQPLSQVIERFNKDHTPGGQLSTDSVKAAVSRVPPKVAKANLNLTVKRDERNGRLPYRLGDAGKYVVDAVAMGATYQIACQYAGISQGTMYRWLNKAEKILERLDREFSHNEHNGQGQNGQDIDPVVTEEEVVYLDFYMRLKQAEGEAVLGWLAVIKKAAEEDGKWQAATWMLERRHPESYGKTTQVNQHHTRETKTVDEWKGQQKKRIEAAHEVIAEFEDAEDVDFRVLGTPVPQVPETTEATETAED